MPDDSITLKVQLDTSDLENNLNKSVKNGISTGTRDGAKELTNQIQISYADALKATTPDLKEIKKAAQTMIQFDKKTIIADKEESIKRIIEKREEASRARRADQARIKLEEDNRRLQHAKEIADYREASRKRTIALQEANRAQRTSGTLSGLFGGLLGQIIDFPSSIRDARQFSKDFDLGARMAGRMKTLHPDYDPYADPNASAGFRAGYTGQNKLAGVLGKAVPAIMAALAIVGIFKKAILDPIVKVGKKVVGYFVDIAKQTETLQALFNLIALPFKIIFTLGFIGPLMAFIPVLKEMINWITENKEVIQSISDTLASVFTNIFTEERIGIVTELLDRFAGVLQFLADSLALNMSTVNTENVAAFIATTITSVVGFIQDVLMSIVAFCYSPEGQAFIVSMAEGIGKLIGTLVDLLIAMLPIFIEMAAVAIVGIVEGIISTVGKAIANLFDIIDKATGGALTGFVNGILSIANWFIDRINDAIGFINSINPFGQIDKLGRMDMWSAGSVGGNFGTATTTAYNTHTISNMFTITNNNQLSNSDTMRNLMMTGL